MELTGLSLKTLIRQRQLRRLDLIEIQGENIKYKSVKNSDNVAKSALLVYRNKKSPMAHLLRAPNPTEPNLSLAFDILTHQTN